MVNEAEESVAFSGIASPKHCSCCLQAHKPTIVGKHHFLLPHSPFIPKLRSVVEPNLPSPREQLSPSGAGLGKEGAVERWLSCRALSKHTFSSPGLDFHRSCPLYLRRPRSTFHLQLQHAKFLQQSNIRRLKGKLTGKNQFRPQKSVIHYSPKLAMEHPLAKGRCTKRFLMIYIKM